MKADLIEHLVCLSTVLGAFTGHTTLHLHNDCDLHIMTPFYW